MSALRIKLTGEGHYHIYSRFVLGEFLLTERKEIAFWMSSEQILARISAKLGYAMAKGGYQQRR